MGLLRTILIILVVYYGLKLLTRLLAPYFVSYMSKKMQDRYSGQNPFGARQQESPRNVGETVIDKVPKQQSSSDENVGEYIDYEEIDD